jgi:hypothetical protein
MRTWTASLVGVSKKSTASRSEFCGSADRT